MKRTQELYFYFLTKYKVDTFTKIKVMARLAYLAKIKTQPKL